MLGDQNFKRTKYTCFYTYLAMSSIFSLPPLLFVTFRQMYGISYTLLGTLVLVNFCTQLIIDLIFSFFSRYFNIRKTIRVMPLLTSLGLILYALIPAFWPQYAYGGLLVGTVIFSVAAGLCEVLLSPLVAALPSDNPDRDMSTLHSLYAYGVVTVVVISSIYLKVFGTENWIYLTLFWAILPIISCVLYCLSPIPDMNMSHEEAAAKTKTRKSFGFVLCLLCIFFGSAAENSMTNWISTYIGNALQISKIVGDILGMALFAVCLGLGRTLYAKYGKHIYRVLLAGMLGSVVCYLIVGLSGNAIVAMCACVITGFCTSMLWPGTLILMEEKFPTLGVAAYALMAAGGDLGASIAPQLVGVIIDTSSASNWAVQLGNTLSLSTEQIGMKTGMLFAAVFPILGTVILVVMGKVFSRKPKESVLS